jgi:hypothetical protein
MYTAEHLYFLSYTQSVADKREKTGDILTSILKMQKPEMTAMSICPYT